MNRLLRKISWYCLLLLFVNGPGNCSAEDHVVLRDLTLLTNVTIAEMNVDGLHLSDGRHFAWSRIKQGQVGDLQGQFDQLLRDVGAPLFRLRARLASRDFDELAPMTESLLAELSKEETQSTNATGVTEYITNASVFQSRMAAGNRTLAVIPLLQMMELREKHPALVDYDEEVGLKLSDSGLASNLLPIWFDQGAAADSLKQVLSRHLLTEPGAFTNSLAFKVYACSLSVAADPATDLSKWDLPDGWKTILSTQSLLLNNQSQEATETLGRLPQNPTVEQQAMAVYYRGTIARMSALTVTDDSVDKANEDLTRHQWIVELLRVPANFENTFPELSAAALHQIVTHPKVSPALVAKLKAELTGRFANTHYGRQWSKQPKQPTAKYP